jgi:hypothetical protein
MNPTLRMCDGARAPSRFGKRRAGMVAAVIAASGALLLAGCGGSSTSTTTTGGASSARSPAVSAGGDSGAPSPPAGVVADEVRFARCIRSHGVSDFPDPSNSGQLAIPPDDRNTPAFERALKACQSLMPGRAGGAGPSGQKSDMTRAQALRVATCMRAHGVPNFPDPDASGAIPPGSVNPNAPQVRSALQRCQPSGSTPAP